MILLHRDRQTDRQTFSLKLQFTSAERMQLTTITTTRDIRVQLPTSISLSTVLETKLYELKSSLMLIL